MLIGHSLLRLSRGLVAITTLSRLDASLKNCRVFNKLAIFRPINNAIFMLGHALIDTINNLAVFGALAMRVCLRRP